MISRVVKKCLVRTISAPKQVKTLIGRSQHCYKNALIIVDAATGYVIVYPSQNLLAAIVNKHLLTYLSSHLLQEEITADFDTEL